jgi:F-box interacting protein
VIICNPLTGENTKLELPKASPSVEEVNSHRFAMGFSPSCKEYKLFRLSYLDSYHSTTSDSFIDVCTLVGDSPRWRRHPHPFQHRPVVADSPPVLIHGKIYVVLSTYPLKFENRPNMILEIDVATEAHRTHSLPYCEDATDDDQWVTAFELRGKLCVAVNTGAYSYHPKLKFWILEEFQNDEGRHSYYWDPRYSFTLDANIITQDIMQSQRCAWLDDDGMLCYTVGTTLYRYDTRGTTSNQLKLQLPATIESTSTVRVWKVCGGYRPTLLSPLTFASSPSREAEERFNKGFLRVLRFGISN